jgi:hypothetical protein
MSACTHPDLRDLAHINGSGGRIVNVLQCRKCGAYIERETTDRPMTDPEVLRKLITGTPGKVITPKWGERDG